MPEALMTLRAASSRKHSWSIHTEKSSASSASAASARATGSKSILLPGLSFSTAFLSLFGGTITSWSAKVETAARFGLLWLIVVFLFHSRRRLRLLEQRLLFDHLGLAAFAPLRPRIVRIGIASPVGSEIAARADERARIGDHVEHALIESLSGNRLGEKFGHAGIARGDHALLLRVAGQHDDRHIGIIVGARLADHLRQFHAVEASH